MVKILLIDDDSAVREATRMVLGDAGHQVLEAVSGLRIEEIIDGEKPELILTDMLMPDRDGVETILALRRRYPRLRIIAMSGGGTRGDLDLGVAKKLGVSATLAKPYEPERLLSLITEIIAGPDPQPRPPS